MPVSTNPSCPDRYIRKRGNMFYYRRRIPKEIAPFDTRPELICETLGTSNIYEARAKRDLLEAGDNDYWSSLLLGQKKDTARSRYEVARNRARALGLSYKPAIELATEPIVEILARLDIITRNLSDKTAFHEMNRQVFETALGLVPEPDVTLEEVEALYFDEIAPPLILNKSEGQRHHWKKERQSSFKLLRGVIGNKAIKEINRQDALAFYKHLMSKVAPKSGMPTHSISFGRKQIGRIRQIYTAYFRHIGEMDRPNPFDGLTFNDKAPKSRPPFPLPWIKDKILKFGALSTMNPDARAVLLTLIDTGARLGEITNLTADSIHLEEPVPYIEIAPCFDGDNRREIKTRSSIRKIPLVGLALAAMRKYPTGFARYRDKETGLSNTLNKFFRDHNLFPSPDHAIYSFRHSFEDRMKEAGIDHELRCALMGHAIKRPRYGSGGSLEWQHRELKKIEIEFDEGIV